MEYRQLSNGIKIPVLGYGLFMVDPLKSEEYVSQAIETGYRLIDTAQVYNNEEGVGNAVKKSGIKRDEFFNNSILKSIGEKYNKTAAQTALRFLIQKGIIVIPKTVKIERMKENFNIFDFNISSEDMQLINSLDTKKALIGDFTDIEYNKYVLNIKL